MTSRNTKTHSTHPTIATLWTWIGCNFICQFLQTRKGFLILAQIHLLSYRDWLMDVWIDLLDGNVAYQFTLTNFFSMKFIYNGNTGCFSQFIVLKGSLFIQVFFLIWFNIGFHWQTWIVWNFIHLFLQTRKRFLILVQIHLLFRLVPINAPLSLMVSQDVSC